MKATSLILTVSGLVLFHGWSAAQAQTTTYTVSNLGPLPGAQVGRAQAGDRTNFAAARVHVNEASATQRLPMFYQEDTPFLTQVRQPVAHLLGGRLRFEAFYRETSINNMVRGVAQSNDSCPPMPGGQSLRPAKSYGINLAFAFSNRRAKER